MTVTVTPTEFTFVAFDAAAIEAAVVGACSSALGHRRPRRRDRGRRDHAPGPRPRSRSATPIVIRADSGAFEDTRQPRQLSSARVGHLARARAAARARPADGGFGEAPPDDELDLAQMAAWETYCVGRLERLGIRCNQPALAVQLPQPARLHRRRRRVLRLGSGRPTA